MKRFRQSVLSVLVLAFSFFVVHDYVVNAESDVCLQAQVHTCTTDVNLNLLEQSHDKIHAMFQINLEELIFVEKTFLQTFSFSEPRVLFSFLIFPLDKPPV